MWMRLFASSGRASEAAGQQVALIVQRDSVSTDQAHPPSQPAAERGVFFRTYTCPGWSQALCLLWGLFHMPGAGWVLHSIRTLLNIIFTPPQVSSHVWLVRVSPTMICFRCFILGWFAWTFSANSNRLQVDGLFSPSRVSPSSFISQGVRFSFIFSMIPWLSHYRNHTLLWVVVVHGYVSRVLLVPAGVQFEAASGEAHPHNKFLNKWVC